MPDTSTELKREKAPGSDRPLPFGGSQIANVIQQKVRFVPLLITLVVVAVAAPLTWAMWTTYMETLWTRDGTVRAYVVTVAPEVAGRIVELAVADNQFVHKGTR